MFYILGIIAIIGLGLIIKGAGRIKKNGELEGLSLLSIIIGLILFLGASSIASFFGLI
jgi:hypothetical protein